VTLSIRYYAVIFFTASACCTVMFKCSCNEIPLPFLKDAPMHVNSDIDVPEYEIDPKELEFTSGKALSKVCVDY
jgi:hypothetical protein